MNSSKIARYARFGLIGGTAIGTFSGFIVSGPHLHTWPPSLLLSVVVGSAALGAWIGYLALALIVGALARGEPQGDIALGTDDSQIHSLNAVANEHHGIDSHHGDGSYTSPD